MNIDEVLPDPEWMRPVMFYGKPLLFNPNNHRYTWDGKHVPSVTTILRRLDKPQLVQWAANCAVEHIKNWWLNYHGDALESYLPEVCEEARKAHATKRDAAADVGTAVHEAARRLLGGAEAVVLPMNEQAVHALRAFVQWRGQHQIEPLALERRVFSRDLMYAGTCDFYGVIDREPAILDFKTGNGVYDEAWFQLAGYERALSEEIGTPPLTHWVIHLGKNSGECRAYRRAPHETAAAHSVWSCLVGLDKAIRAMPKMERAA